MPRLRALAGAWADAIAVRLAPTKPGKVRALARRGLPRVEIARRTGLPYDAVTLALAADRSPRRAAYRTPLQVPAQAPGAAAR